MIEAINGNSHCKRHEPKIVVILGLLNMAIYTRKNKTRLK